MPGAALAVPHNLPATTGMGAAGALDMPRQCPVVIKMLLKNFLYADCNFDRIASTIMTMASQGTAL